jgi:hypothetical protein
MWSMTVIDDHAPSDPTMLYPAIDAAILIAGAHFAIGNSSDLDGDPITYSFELDSAPTFDSPDLQSSGSRPGVATGITEWMPNEAGLHVGRWYWRASASDGHVSTSPMVGRGRRPGGLDAARVQLQRERASHDPRIARRPCADRPRDRCASSSPLTLP